MTDDHCGTAAPRLFAQIPAILTRLCYAISPVTRESPAVKATDKAVREYYSALAQGAGAGIEHELGLRHAFEALLEQTARRARGWQLAREHSFRRGGWTIRPDGTLLDDFRLPRGWYEAKGPGVDLDREVRGKLDGGYPRENTLFRGSSSTHFPKRQSLAHPERHWR